MYQIRSANSSLISVASVDGFVLSPSPNEVTLPLGDSYMIQILEAKIEYFTADKTRQVKGGYLTLRGWLKKLSSFELREFAPCSWSMDDHGHPLVSFLFTDENLRPDSEELFLLHIIQLQDRDDPEPTSEVHGLVLAATLQKNQYRRVGKFEQALHDDEDPFNMPTYPTTPDPTSDQSASECSLAQDNDDIENCGQKAINLETSGAGDKQQLPRNDPTETGHPGSAKSRKKHEDKCKAAGWVESVITII